MVHVHRLRMTDTDVDRLFKSRIREVDRGRVELLLAAGRLIRFTTEGVLSRSGRIPPLVLSNCDLVPSSIFLTNLKNERREGRKKEFSISRHLFFLLLPFEIFIKRNFTRRILKSILFPDNPIKYSICAVCIYTISYHTAHWEDNTLFENTRGNLICYFTRYLYTG